MLVAKAVPVVAVSAVLLAVPLAVDYQPIGTVPGTITAEQARLGAKSARFYGEFGSLQDDASVAPRLQSWRDGWETYKQAPVTGVGINAFGQAQHDRGASLDWPTSLLKTTNLWVESLAEMGPLGLFALVVWAFTPLPFLARRRRENPLAVPLLAALLASSAMFAFTQTWWVPYRWVPWIFGYALVGSELTRWARARVGR
jgi:O-antigen ligase